MYIKEFNKKNKEKIILTIETSGKVCSVSLSKIDDKFKQNSNSNLEIIAEYSIFIGNKHDKFAAELCKRILSDNDLKINDLAAIAVSIGPGSFTGLRIGVAIAKGLCFDYDFGDKTEQNLTKTKLIAVPTLNAMANRAVDFVKNFVPNNENFEILAIIPSHANFVYYKLFCKDNLANSKQINEISFADLYELKNQFSEKNNLFITTNQKINIDFGIIIPELMQISAATVATFAAKMFLNDKFANAEDLIPLYVQDFVPKNNLS